MPCACSVNTNNNLVVAVPILIFQVRRADKWLAQGTYHSPYMSVWLLCSSSYLCSYPLEFWWLCLWWARLQRSPGQTWGRRLLVRLLSRGRGSGQLRVFWVCPSSAGWSLIIFSVVASPNGSVLTISDSLLLGKGSDQLGFALCLFRETQCHILYRNTL